MDLKSERLLLIKVKWVTPKVSCLSPEEKHEAKGKKVVFKHHLVSFLRSASGI